MVEITNLVANYGMTVIVCGLFVWQYMRQQKYNEVREEKLYSVIDAMSKLLPEIRDDVQKILHSVKKGE
jgi:hypothetical protein